MITVWRITLDPSQAPGPAELEILSAQERARSVRFAREADRNRWLHAHVATRRILGVALGVAPGVIVFEEGAGGKPFVAVPADSGLEFNLSDAGDVALLAVSRDGVVGVDVERIRPLSDLVAVVERHFAVEEREALFALPEGEWLEAFYRIWTRKEAYIKAIGSGLGHALDRFAVTIERGEARFVHLDGSAEAARGWSLRAISVGPEYQGALAVPGRSIEVEVCDWS